MRESATIEKTCAVTRKGQTTLPLSVRQILGVAEGGRILVRAEGHRISIEAVGGEHRDPAIGAFLRLIANDIAAGRNIGGIPETTLQALKQISADEDVNLEDAIEGDVCL